MTNRVTRRWAVSFAKEIDECSINVMKGVITESMVDCVKADLTWISRVDGLNAVRELCMSSSFYNVNCLDNCFWGYHNSVIDCFAAVIK